MDGSAERRSLVVLAYSFFVIAFTWLIAPLFLSWTRTQSVLPYVVAAGLLSAGIGFGLIRSAYPREKPVIPKEDREYLGSVLHRSPDPIADYQRLSGLVG